MDPRQKKLEKKKKRREKIRREHLQRQQGEKLRQIDQAFQKLLDYQYTLGKDVIPDRNDEKGWGRIDLFRSLRGCWEKTIETFGRREELVRFSRGDIYEDEDDVLTKVSWYLTVGAMRLCFDPPYFIPYFAFSHGEPLFGMFTVRRPIGRYNCWTVSGLTKEVTIKGEKIPVYFSDHSLWRLWERASFSAVQEDNMLIRSCMFTKMFEGFEIQSLDDEKLCLLNRDKRLIPLLGENEPFGYCPFNYSEGKRGDKGIICTTFLLPGFRSTPEGMVLGQSVDIKNVVDVRSLKSQFEMAGLRSFVSEATAACEKIRKHRQVHNINNAEFLGELWTIAKDFIKVPAMPDEFKAG